MTDCLFCRIARGEAPARIVAEDERVVAFEDLHPQAPSHTLVIPRRHIAAVSEAAGEDRDLLGELLLAAAQVARSKGLEAGGYRIVTNCGAGAGQSVFHLHLHVLGGRRFHWPPG